MLLIDLVKQRPGTSSSAQEQQSCQIHLVIKNTLMANQLCNNPKLLKRYDNTMKQKGKAHQRTFTC